MYALVLQLPAAHHAGRQRPRADADQQPHRRPGRQPLLHPRRER